MARRGEEIASLYLIQQGYRELKRNWRCRFGELDLVMQKGKEIVIVEVKSRVADRVTARAEYLTESVDRRKQRKLVKLSEIFMRSQFGRHYQPRLRIDVIGVVFSADRLAVLSIQHLIAAVSAE